MKNDNMNEKDLRNATGRGKAEDYEFVVMEGNYVNGDPMGSTRYWALETVMTNNDGDPVRTRCVCNAGDPTHSYEVEKTISVYWMYSCYESFGGHLG